MPMAMILTDRSPAEGLPKTETAAGKLAAVWLVLDGSGKKDGLQT